MSRRPATRVWSAGRRPAAADWVSRLATKTGASSDHVALVFAASLLIPAGGRRPRPADRPLVVPTRERSSAVSRSAVDVETASREFYAVPHFLPGDP